MSEHTVDLNEKDFDSNIEKGKWIVDFWATWCGPCKMMAPHFEAVAKDFKGDIHFAKINVDENYEIANRFQVMSIPTTIFFENGEVIHASVGAMNKEQLTEVIANTFK